MKNIPNPGCQNTLLNDPIVEFLWSPGLIKEAAMLLLPPVSLQQQRWFGVEGGRLSEGCSLAVSTALLTMQWSNKAARTYARAGNYY